ncbi:allophanate hydrolase [Microbacterium sp. SORGH_AS 1204]|uniref:allophanate hydrolase n=1 Tax=Microbacterium sp. SORGH_AS_1204 TaxID=3041785 RepID=UPI002790F9EF|nr:allophanate hydrolase [Microbacterium sp. SORGH_AS_1204]MDQ1136254.1 allophanate hydrolase [Microbacterium sp. SORGH_AS_1204]
MTTSARRVAAAYAAIREAERPEVWITLRAEADAVREAAEVDERAATGTDLPLRGMVVAVKDNIDVAGLPTTAGYPAAAAVPATDATAVALLRAAGAVVIGKTNLDQFATGLVGTRSPYGAVRNALHPDRISGGSSSGSAVAVALGMVDIALGTDTAGSGRVPAALNAIVGIKPTLGLVSTTGMLPACHPYDTITVFARALDTAVRATAVIARPDGSDPRSRSWPADVRIGVADRPVVAVPSAADLTALDQVSRASWEAACARLAKVATLREVEIAPLLGAAKLLYEGAIVAGRYAAAGAWVDAADGADAESLDPTVAGIVRGARDVRAVDYIRDRAELDGIAALAREILDGCAVLAVPSAPLHPTIAEVNAEPLAVNARMGTFTNFVNLLDMAAAAVPASSRADGEFGVTFIADAFDDQLALDVAASFLAGLPTSAPLLVGEDASVPLAVFGAHLRGEPLNPQLVELGARFVGDVVTSPDYRLFALNTEPPKPGLVEVEADGASIAGELWRLSPAALGRFLAALPAPMTLGRVRLDDGSEVVGFGCAPGALAAADDITAFGGWRAFRRAGA